MARARDAQKSKAYAAESHLPDRWTNIFGSNADAQAWVDNILADRWFRQRWQHPRRLHVATGRNLNGRSFGGTVTLSPAGRNPVVALHEIAHEVVGADYRVPDARASHGPEFCATFLFLVEHYIGKEAAGLLREGFRVNKVRYRVPAGLVPRSPRYEVPTEAEAAAVKREAAARPLTTAERQRAVEVLRRAVRNGEFGPAGSRTRTAALATARRLEKPEDG